MKALFKVTVLLLLITSSCSSKENVLDDPTVELSFSYVLSNSGRLTKSVSDDIYQSFYDSYVKTKEVLPKSYFLQVKNSSEEVIATLYGDWEKKDVVKLPLGTYHVVGYSRGGTYSADNYRKASLIFDEKITINSYTTEVVLNAQYNCFLLLFNGSGKSGFTWTADGTAQPDVSGDVPKAGDLYYLFVRTYNSNISISWIYGSNTNSMNLYYDFKNGYYYYFDDISGTFNIPKMQNGF